MKLHSLFWTQDALNLAAMTPRLRPRRLTKGDVKRIEAHKAVRAKGKIQRKARAKNRRKK